MKNRFLKTKVLTYILIFLLIILKFKCHPTKNHMPDKPFILNGQHTGVLKVTYGFRCFATDPDSDSVAIRFDWGDGNISDWSPYVPSGQVVMMNHSWQNADTYYIKAQAKDRKGAISEWSSEYEIIILNVSGIKCQEVGYYDTPGVAEDVVVISNYAYVADGLSGLRIIDITNPQNPLEVGYYDTPGYAFSVAVANNYAYVADGLSGLRIIDITNPQNPSEIGYYDELWAEDVAVASNYAYVGTWNGLSIIDISNPQNPSQVTWFQNYSYYGVAVTNNYAYIAAGDYGLRIIDISNPQNPLEVGNYIAPGFSKDIIVLNNYAYLANGECGLRIIEFYEMGIK